MTERSVREEDLYVGQDRFEVRKQIEKDLAAAGLMEKIEDYDNKVGYSERTNVVIEPKLSMQWFLKMSDLARPALEAVMNDDIGSIRPNTKTLTVTGWRTSKTGVSRVSSGGASNSRILFAARRFMW